MEEFICEGVVLREKLQKESDKLLTILTPNHGKLYAYARGVKNIAGKNAPACQLFAFSEFHIVNSRGRNVVKNAVVKDIFFGMRSDTERFALVSYFSDVLCHVTMENNDETQPLRLFLNCAYALANKKEIPLWLIKSAFELRLCCILGFKPDFTSCPICGKENVIGNVNYFSPDLSAVVCAECRDKMKAQSDRTFYCSAVSRDVLEGMLHICLADIKRFLSFKIHEDLANELSFICESYLINKTERTYETLKIYKAIVNSLQLT